MQRLSGRIDLIFDMSSSAEISDNQKAVQEDKAKLEIDVPMTLSSDSDQSQDLSDSKDS